MALVFYGFILLMAYLMYLVCKPFLRPLVWGAIIAAYFHPQYRRLEARMGRARAATIGTIFVGLLIIVPFVLILITFIKQANETFGTIDASTGSAGIAQLETAWGWAQSHAFGAAIGSFEEAKQKATSWLTSVVTAAAGGSGKERDGNRCEPRDQPLCHILFLSRR